MKAKRLALPFHAKIPRDIYVKKFGPTVGDKVGIKLVVNKI